MIESVVKEIGSEALNNEESLIILFDESVTEGLGKHCVIQKFSGARSFNLKEGQTISFDDQNYSIKKVGEVTNKFLDEMGHVSVVFGPIPTEDRLVNALYVEPYEVPTIKAGTLIKYQ
ncbi:PTS glucitol/sorbitol transporter subunit IIA [Vagococcus silagei]|uniref:PTS sorbitol transporter subunit IIA n=1 Tax=Vagococcus silagei TaxID=2508885 RepID=A0A4S3B4D7_9ENTE|nr:PTS glucitol/sorbitol transporter subunit IIA [Vagococcus silagei]THB60670.1 PTS sorbitol transporter subunit IIA [Vagococcus silagei]